MIEPLRMSFELACPVERAFETWTYRISSWWPADHTASGSSEALVVLEPHVGGRIYERLQDGQEHEWGEVTVWEPPARLGYLWHLRRDRADATDVEIRFIPLTPARTRVEIEHRGWERLRSDGQAWRDRNRGGWDSLLPHFIATSEREPATAAKESEK